MDKHLSFRTLLMAAGLTAGLNAVSAQAGPRYEVADLGVIDPTAISNSFSQALSVNDSGMAAGFGLRRTPSQLRAVSADAGNAPGLSELPGLGGSHAQALAINAAGDLAGSAFLAGDAIYHAALWKQGVISDLGTLGGANSRARGLNDAGDVVGASNLTGSNAEHAVLWSGGTATDLGTFGGANSQANGINAARQVTGYAALANGQQHAFLWQGAGLTDLGTLGGSYSEGYAINDAGDVVGYAGTAQDAAQHATLWRAGATAKDLGTLGGSYSEAYGINASGQIVGTSTLARDQIKRGFLYENNAMVDLNSLIVPTGGLSIVDAYGISPNGLIAGVAKREGVFQTGVFTSEFHAVVLIPDRTKPQITCPAAINTTAQPASLGTAVAQDNLDPAPVVTHNAPNPLAVDAITLVTWTATDGAGNQGQCTQLVTVGTPPPGSTPIQPPGTPQDPVVPETPALPPVTDPGTPGSPGTPGTPASPGDTGDASGALPIAASGARLELESQLLKPATKRLRQGAKLVYRLRIANAGTGTARSIALSNELSSRLRLRKAQPSQGSCALSPQGKNKLGGTLNCVLGDLSAGQELQVEITALARKRGAVINRIVVGMAGGASSATALQLKVR
jgi:probable HAF family extracellular repeat protein